MVAGFACQQIQSVLDGCDGELARVRFQQSKLGAWLDTFVDDVLNVLITVAVGIGLWRGRRRDLGAGGRDRGRRDAGRIQPDHHARHAPAEGQRRPDGHGLVVLGRAGSWAAMPARTPTAGPASGPSCFSWAGATPPSLLWLLFALAGLPVLALIMAGIIALAWFVASVVQLVVRAGRRLPMSM